MSLNPPPCSLSPQVERALYLCGKDRVFHNNGLPPSVAIDTQGMGLSTPRYLTCSGDTHDEAGRKVAVGVAEAMRERARQLKASANSIYDALQKRIEPV